MTKHTRTKIPIEATRVINVSTGGSRISMGDGIGWVSGPYDAIKAVQKLVIDGENYRKQLSEYKADFETMYAELVLTRNQLDNANAKLHGTRQHRTEVSIDKITTKNDNGSITTAILLADNKDTGE